MNVELFPLTSPQKNIFQLEQVNINNTNLNTIYSVLKLPNDTDLKLLDITLNKIRELNDSLRLRFCTKTSDCNSNSTDKKINLKDTSTPISDDMIFQYVEKYEYIPSRIIYHDSESILDVIENEKKDTLSIDGKLAELAIIKTPFNCFVLYKTHHILSDGWGMTQVADQIKEIYCKLENGEDLSDYKKPSYIGFIHREQEYLQSSRYEKDIAFWKDTVKKIEPCTVLNKTNNFDKKAKRFEHEIPTNICERINKFCSDNKITEYSFFLAIISIYFYHIYDLNNFAIGTPFLNRQKRNGEFEETGLHISTLPLHVDIQSDASFLDLCSHINSNNLSLYKHGSFPYHSIQKLFIEEKNINGNLYEIGFSYQINVSEKKFVSKTYDKTNNANWNKGIGECSWLFSGEQNNSITFHLTQLNVRKLFAIDYLTSVFSDDDIVKMNSCIFFLIGQVLDIKNSDSQTNNSNFQVRNPEINTYDLLVKNLQVVTPNELTVLSKFNNTGKIEKIDKTVIDYFEEIVQKHPNKTALICDNQKLSYKEFNDKVTFLAYKLLKNKIETKTPIVLLFDKSFDMLISMFAVIKIGCFYVPILPDESESRIKYIIQDCKPSCILTHKNYDNLVSKFGVCYFNLDNFDYENNPKQQIVLPTNEDLAYMIYTSGSTGNPKGVQIMHKNIVGFVESIRQNSIIKPTISDISMSLLKYSFDASGIDIYSSLLVGGTLLIVSKNDELNPIKVLELIEKYKVTRSFLIPKWIEHIATTSLNYNYDISSLKILGTGGEVLKPNILKTFLEKYPNLKIANLYGPTETTMFATYKIISNLEISNNHTTIGQPIPYSRIAIVNSKNVFLPTNCEGELIIYEDDDSIENIAKGYLNLPEQTNNKFIHIFNPITNSIVKAYKTGDIAKINNNLEIEFLGRTDDIVKVNGGYLVALNEVEKRISDLLGENIESYCVAVPYKNTKAIVLFVKKDEKSISITNIKRYLKQNLSFYMQPKRIIELCEIPRNSSGKVHRQALKDLAIKEMQMQNNNIIKPRTNIELEIYDIIKNLIHIDDFSITDDFLDDLGIDSLTLTSIYVALHDYNLTMQDFYNNPNIHDLAQYIENNIHSCLEPDITNIEDIEILNNSINFDLSSVLLTGVTGFLGIHLLHELLLNKKVKKIYCIIRNKIGLEGSIRLKNMIDYYYNSDEKLFKLIYEKVIILNGDITKPNFNLSKDIYILLKKSVKTVINSAANVKHFAKPMQIKNDNVVSVDTIIDFCENNISFAHISTLSIAGFKNKSTCNKIFDENTLYIKQSFNNNPYLISKFNAEVHILKTIKNNGLHAKIFRLGNIMPRKSDGKFQQNYNQNIFISALKTILNLQVVPKELLDLKLEFSPVDECAKSILQLINCKSNSIYHILNNNEISIKELIDIFEKFGYTFKFVSMPKFMEALNTTNDEYVKEYILSTNLNLFSQERTLSLLKNNDFNWSIIDENYISKILNLIKK